MSAVVAELISGSEENVEHAVIVGLKLHENDVKDVSGSQDMFSDDDQAKSTVYFSPKVTVSNDTLSTSIISLKTPKLNATKIEETPGKPRVPKTPADLVPFITKTSILWTSDMETPESKLRVKSDSCDKMEDIFNINCTPPNQRPSTPTCADIKKENMDILTSPVLGGKKRSKRCAKRRILNNVIVDSESNQNSISSNSDKALYDTTTSEICTIQEAKKTELISKELIESKECNSENKENKLLEEPSHFDKNSNTSTQEFFCNASFSSIDQLCSNVIQEEKPMLTASTDDLKTKNDIHIKKEKISQDEDKQVDIDNNVLERIAAIKKNQKPLRRLSDINHTVLPKDVFSSSARELELANAKFNCEKKERRSEPLKSTSFIKLSLLDDNKLVNEQKDSSVNSQDVPNEIMDDWNTVNIKTEKLSNETELPNVSENKTIHNNFSNITVKQEYKENEQAIEQNLERETKTDDFNLHSDFKSSTTDSNENKLPDLSNNYSDANIGFATANGKGITISEDKLSNYMKIYSEIENENLNENLFIGLKKNKLSKQPLKNNSKLNTKPIIDIKTDESKLPVVKENVIDKKTEKLKLFQELDLEEFLEPKFSPECREDDGFSTASGKNIKVSKDKEEYYSNLYDKLGDVDENGLSAAKQPKKLPLKVNVKQANKALIVLKKDEDNSSIKVYDEQICTLTETVAESESQSISDGFSTAGGKKIDVNEEKESYYSKIYETLNADETDLLNIKQNKSKKFISNKPFSKPTETKKLMKPPIQKTKSSATNIENTSDGFSTGSGKSIAISKEKENYYSKIYETLNADETDLLNIKQNKSNKFISSKPFSKLAQTKKLMKAPMQETKSTAIINIENTCDELSTGNCKSIAINKEKGNYYSNINNQLSKEITDENALINHNKKTQLKPTSNTKVINKLPVANNTKNSEDTTSDTKLSISSDTDEVFCNLDLEKLFTPPFQADVEKTKSKDEDHFTVPTASHISKKTIQASNLPKPTVVKQDKIDENITPVMSSTPLRNLPQSKIAEKIQVNMLKRKLENCEPKLPERCRSFGGFPQNGSSPRVSKLNKSDPLDESHVNQPLQKGLSVSQCFDPHSDSWLSKIELSYLNSSRTDAKSEKREPSVEEPSIKPSLWKTDDESELAGFSDKETAESFRRYARFKKFVEKDSIKYNSCTSICVDSGQGATVTNKTLSKQILHANSKGINTEKGTVNSHCDENILQKTCSELSGSSTSQPKLVVEVYKINKPGEKRKHDDTDSDTPLTVSKKPRVGLEFPGRKLFTDESDVETDCTCESENQIKNKQVALQNNDEEIIEEDDLPVKRLEAVMQQEKMIRSKNRIKVKPIMGSLLHERITNSKNRKSWSDIAGESVPTARNLKQIKEFHLDEKVLEVTASNAANYTFLTSNIVGNKKVAYLALKDGAKLIFNENGHVGVSEFSNAFLAMPGVDPKLLHSDWIRNHYRWIVWKLASMDRMDFKSLHLPKVLTPERVMKELKYRYDREIDRSERPALRKILEKDEVPSRRLVLCISSIEETVVGEDSDKEARVILGLPRWKVEATDGWYNIPLLIDNIIANNISNGKIKEGTKIITYGAELMDCERGFHPLDKPANVSLKIYSNCTRRVKWDTKLGFQKISRPIPVKLRSIVPGGGLVGQTTVVAARVYPLLYREKTANGQSIYRNARSEEKAAIAHERACELKVDAMYAEAEKKFDSRKKSDSDEDMESSHCRMERKQAEFKQKLESEVRDGLPPPRQVTPVLKIRLVDDCTTAVLSIWGANEDSAYDIKEGNTITLYNTFATGSRAGELSLTANRITHVKTETLLKLPYPSRTCTLIKDITSSLFEPKFNEFDTVGVVVSSGPAPHGMKNFDVVNLAHPKPQEGSAYLCVLFWGGVSSFGYQALCQPGTVVACSNLEWRRGASWSLPIAYCSEKSLLTCNPRQAYLAKEIRDLKNLVQNTTVYAESCAEEVKIKLAEKPRPRSCTGTPTERLSFHGNVSVNSPQESLIKVSVQQRLEKLSQYGGVDDVSPSIVLNNSSNRVKKDYTPVTPRSNT